MTTTTPDLATWRRALHAAVDVLFDELAASPAQRDAAAAVALSGGHGWRRLLRAVADGGTDRVAVADLADDEVEAHAWRTSLGMAAKAAGGYRDLPGLGIDGDDIITTPALREALDAELAAVGA